MLTTTSHYPPQGIDIRNLGGQALGQTYRQKRVDNYGSPNISRSPPELGSKQAWG